MAAMYWRISWAKKGDQDSRARFEVVCSTEGQCERYRRMLEKDMTVDKIQVTKELLLPRDGDKTKK